MADLARHDEVPGVAVAGEDEDTGAQIAPIVQLAEVAVVTGEEEEGILLDLKAKLYRFDKDGNQWKERGTGSVKLLKHKKTGKVRLVMRQNKTLKICANHFVLSMLKIQEHAGNDKSCVWHATDFSDGELKDEMFCMRFGSVENCRLFMESVEKIAEAIGENEEESEAASAAVELLENLTVGEHESEVQKPVKEEVSPPPAAAADNDEESAEKPKSETKAEEATS